MTNSGFDGLRIHHDHAYASTRGSAPELRTPLPRSMTMPALDPSDQGGEMRIGEAIRSNRARPARPLSISGNVKTKQTGLRQQSTQRDSSTREGSGNEPKHCALPVCASGRYCAVKNARRIHDQTPFWISPVLSIEAVEHSFVSCRTQHKDCPEAVSAPNSGVPYR